MKKFIALFLVLVIALPILVSCNDNPETSTDPTEESSQEEPIVLVPDENAKTVWQSEYADASNGFADAEKVYNLSAYSDGKVATDLASLPSGDTRYLFSGEDKTRAVVLSEGYAVTLPGGDVTADFSLGALRSKYFSESEDYVLTVTYEDKNPYGANEHGLIDTYYREWLIRYIGGKAEEDEKNALAFLNANSIRRTRVAGVTEELLEGYTVNYYDMVININSKIEYPFYSIAVVRPTNTYRYFWLFVLKSGKEGTAEKMDSIVKSFKELGDTVGTPTNSVGAYELKIPEFWNDETKAYYQQLLASDTVEMGAFYEGNSVTYQNHLEEIIGNKFDYYMTYFPVGWYDKDLDIDLTRINSQAGGNGTNGKPMLELTYQFTNTNNTLGGITPMYDILRGRHDAQFRKLAQDIKSYGHPVLFRLNNEMNTDWTSYCGMQTMLDPDVFIMTWRRLYNIFIEEGVDNCIWIWNPIATSCPYSNWGDMLNYFPGEDYVQMLGLTYYQMNNGAVNSFKSFKEMYTELYQKNTPYFDNYPAVLGEFGCAAGGDYVYDWSKSDYVVPDNLELRRQHQAEWITGMFDCFLKKNEPGYEFAKNIKVAIWFSANDYAKMGDEYVITNHLQLNDDTPLAIEAFKEGYQKLIDARKK